MSFIYHFDVILRNHLRNRNIDILTYFINLKINGYPSHNKDKHRPASKS